MDLLGYLFKCAFVTLQGYISPAVLLPFFLQEAITRGDNCRSQSIIY